MKDPRFHIQSAPWANRVDLYFLAYGEDGVVRALPVTMEEHKNTAIAAEPTMVFRGPEGTAALQSLMDELWREGYRPEDIGTPGHLAATQAHLKDFRAIVAKTLDIPLP